MSTDILSPHPYADKFPMLPEGELQELAESLTLDHQIKGISRDPICLVWLRKSEAHPRYWHFSIANMRDVVKSRPNRPIRLEGVSTLIAAEAPGAQMRWDTEPIPPQATPRNGVVYFIADEHGRVKIGTTKGNANSRLSSLQTGNADHLTLLGAVVGGTKKEEEIHGRFSSDHIRAEWFRLTPEIRNYINAEVTK